MLLPIQTITYQYPVNTVFPEKISTIPGTLGPHLTHEGNLEDDILEKLLIIDYRYNRFALDPRTGLFNMVRYVSPVSFTLSVNRPPY